MKDNPNLFKPPSVYKQKPVYVKLLLLFFLLGVSLRLFSFTSFNFSSPVLGTQTSPTIHSQETDLLTSDEGSDSFTSAELFNISSSSTEQFNISTSSTELLYISSNSTELFNISSSSTEVSNISSSSTELFNISSSSTELFSISTNSTDEFNISSSSTEVFDDETKPECDLFKGDWVPNPSGPVYNNESCPFIEPPQNCMTNGRPDFDYLYWRWSPRDCELPKFNPERFLDTVRNKTWAFIGDSISRNYVQSLLCTLSRVEQPRPIYHDEQFKSETFLFSSYNFTVARIWAPFLLKSDTFEDSNGVSTSEIQLNLDKLDEKWTRQYEDFDYVTIAGGKWFLRTAIYYENNTIQGCHYCPGKNLTEVGFDYAYRKALKLVFNFITSSRHKPLVLFRTITPDHFENGEWHNGGTCPRIVPFKEGEANISIVDKILNDIEMQEFDKAVSVGSEKGIVLKLFDTTKLSLLRPDGHPGPYRQFHPFAKDKNAKVQNDCLHWCLPGPIDSWNDLMMQLLING